MVNCCLQEHKSEVTEKYTEDATRMHRRSYLASHLKKRAHLAEEIGAPSKMHPRIYTRSL